MKHKIIIIDDQFSKRRDGYSLLEKAASELDPSFSLEFDYLEQPNELIPKRLHNQYSAAIIDAVLNEEWPRYSISKAIKDIGIDIPIALLSDRWDKTNSDEFDEALKQPNCRTFLHWRDIDPAQNGQIDYAVRALISMIADNKKLNTQIRLKHDEPIQILHISDLQIGGIDKTNLNLEANRCADRILEHTDDQPPTFVAFTGDVAEHGNPVQYGQAREWISYFFERLGLPPLPTQNILYVPGNHDVNINLAASTRIKLTKKADDKINIALDEDVQQQALIDFALMPYRDFLGEISDCPLLTKESNDHSLAWVESRYRHLGVIFYGINTAQPLSSRDFPGRSVDSKALARIDDVIKQVLGGCKSPLPIVELSR
jgi:hypothetical protein